MSAGVRMLWAQKIPLRDGVRLNSTLYLPKNLQAPAPAIVTLTPYISQAYHDRGLYFAEHGYPFVVVDVRGRGNSEGEFKPNIQEARDGHDVVEWLARQPYCNGRVAMWGGSYAGYVQWATAKEFPPHLVTIVPVASPCMGVDFPIRSNIPALYSMQWLTLVWGRTSQEKIFSQDPPFWRARFREAFEFAAPFRQLDAFLGNPSAIFQQWVAHPRRDEYWDSYNPTRQQYARISMPILTITGIYDGDQPGALAHYREHMRNASEESRAQHYLIIGPWDHAGTRVPTTEFGGLTVGSVSLVDLAKLHVEWYAWTLERGPKPEFLKNKVAYYVMGAEKWRYADSLETITARTVSFYLHSRIHLHPAGNPTDVFSSGSLSAEPSRSSAPDHYLYDPRDVGHAGIESTVDPENLTDQRMIHALRGKLLVYHSEPFEQDTQISGFFRLSAWLSIDRPDTDFRVCVYEIDTSGRSVLLSEDWMRARYRDSLYEEKRVCTTEPLRYEFERFTFVSRRIRKGGRLRLVLRPLHSIYSQKNYNSGGVVADESMTDAQPVIVKLFHDELHPSALHVPFGQPVEAES